MHSPHSLMIFSSPSSRSTLAFSPFQPILSLALRSKSLSPANPVFLILFCGLFFALFAHLSDGPRFVFKIACGLFLQTPGVGVAPILPYHQRVTHPRIANTSVARFVSPGRTNCFFFLFFFSPQSFLKINLRCPRMCVFRTSSLLRESLAC